MKQIKNSFLRNLHDKITTKLSSPISIKQSTAPYVFEFILAKCVNYAYTELRQYLHRIYVNTLSVSGNADKSVEEEEWTTKH